MGTPVGAHSAQLPYGEELEWRERREGYVFFRRSYGLVGYRGVKKSFLCAYLLRESTHPDFYPKHLFFRHMVLY